ncbi:MAG: hypothetical protein M3Q00_00300 [Pseudomonadota bacterium]|nr:hypothetical protein [Pseudomonadota bacterium]
MKITLVSISFILLGMGSSWATASDNAIIKNKSLDTQRKELDIAVYVTKVNDLDLEEGQEEIEVTAGERTLDIECIVRSFVGMGTLDLGKSTRMNVKLEAGRTYQLGAKLTKEGECTPTLQ